METGRNTLRNGSTEMKFDYRSGSVLNNGSSDSGGMMKDKPRNPVARSPLMKKGGVHQKSRTSERQREKDAVQSELDELEEEMDEHENSFE